MKIYKKQITVYDLENDFIIEIIEDDKDNTKEFWLSNKYYGVKKFMYGLRCNENDIEKLILSDIKSYIKTYKKEYMEY